MAFNPSLIIIWLFLGAIFTGMGFVLMRAFYRPMDIHGALRAFWVAWAVQMFILQIWHLILPVNSWAFAIVALLGTAGLFLERKIILTALHQWRVWIVPFIAWVILGMVLSHFAMRGGVPYDDGLYHIQDMRWAQSYSIVPGLGNLHGRFAFNNALTLPWAMLDSLPLELSVHHFGYGLLLTMAAAGLLWRGMPALRSQTHSLQAIVSLLLLPALIVVAIEAQSLIGLKNDVFIFLIGALISLEMLDLLVSPPHEVHRTRAIVLYVTLLAAVGVTVKLSFVVFAVCAVLVVSIFAGLRHPQHFRTYLFCILSIGIPIGIVWIARGIILSGYPFYPQKLLPFPVEWLMPAAEAIADNNATMNWGRHRGYLPDTDWNNWQWLGTWTQIIFSEISGFMLPIALFFYGGLIWLTKLKGGALYNLFKSSLLWWFVPFVLGVIFWFFTAPAVRFSWHLFWPASIILLVSSLHDSHRWPIARRVLLTGALFFLVFNVIYFYNKYQIDVPWFTEYHDTYVTESGLMVYLPATKDQCFDAPLPCTPYPKASLSLRQPDNLNSGFINRLTSSP